MDYFPHDTRANGDDRLLALRMDAGLEAVACYWVVLEKIYEREGPFEVSETNVEARSVSYKLGVGFDVFRKYVGAMVSVGLLEVVENEPYTVMSERAQEQIETLNKKRETARQNGKSGGRKPKSKPKRKPSVNQSGTNVGTESAPYKTLNGIGSHKENLYQNDGVADADNSAPPSAPICPLCSSPLRMRISAEGPKWTCSICGDVKEPAYGVPAKEAS